VSATTPRPVAAFGRAARRVGIPAGRSARIGFWSVVASHTITDVYPLFFATLVLALRQDLALTSVQVGTIYAATSILSGFPQGFFAWASDRFDTRLCAPLGLFLSAVCTSLIGFADSFEQLLVLISIGQLGSGMYHPIAAALAGQVGGSVVRTGRAMAVSLFFAAGVIGGVVSPLISTRMTAHWGMQSLVLLMIPGVITAAVLVFVLRGLNHRHADHARIVSTLSPAEARRRWAAVGLLFGGNVMRFIVNSGLVIMFPIWAAARIPGDIPAATALNANLLFAMQIGMGVFAIGVGRAIPAGREKPAMVTLSIVGAVFTAFVGFAGDHLGLWAIYLAAALSSLGFAAVLPMTIGLSQRLLPSRTGLASSLMMGVAWSVGALAPAIASLFMGGVALNEASSLPPDRIAAAFVGFAGLLLVAGLLGAAIPSRLLREVAVHS